MLKQKRLIKNKKTFTETHAFTVKPIEHRASQTTAKLRCYHLENIKTQGIKETWGILLKHEPFIKVRLPTDMTSCFGSSHVCVCLLMHTNIYDSI